MKQTMTKGRNADAKVTAPATRKPVAKNTDQKLVKQPTKKKKEVAVEKKTLTRNPDMVTLTKSEFDAIMETIGKLSMGTEKVDSQATENQMSIARRNQLNSEETEQSFMLNTYDAHHQQNLPPQTTADPLSGIPKTHLTLAEKKRLEWQQENVSAASGWHNRDDNQKAKSDPRPIRDERQAYNKKRMDEQNLDSSTPLFLTAAEKKKLQWEKERAELSALDRYDPWGRSGGGAPIKDLLGNVVNDYTKRQEVLQNAAYQPLPETVSNFKAIDPTEYPSRHPPLQKAQSHPNHMDAVMNGVASSQGPMTSSFRSGALAPGESRVFSEKDRQKLEWLEELEKQREEQRERKLLEKRGHREESPEEYYWAERTRATNQPPAQEQQPHGATRWGDPSTQGQADEYTRHSAPPHKGLGTTALVQIPNGGEGNSTHMHGQNVAVDPVTKREQEEKRRKYLEIQEFNRRQIEEREQQRREEKERRIHEDREDERKFHQMKQGTNTSNNASTLPRPAMKEDVPMSKEELERRKEELLRQGLEAARLEAEREKKQRLIERLRKGNHDVSHLEAKLTSRGAMDISNATHRPLQEPLRQPNASVPVYVEPKYVPGLGDVSSVPNSGPNNHAESHRNNYPDDQGNFMQTSSGRAEKKSREFGTQTESREVSRESTAEVEYRISDQKSNNNNSPKRVRVISAPKPDPRKQRQESGTGSKTRKQNQGERPMWGYRNTSNKKPVKQSDRDAFHGTQERLQRRINRQNELLDMMARNADRVPDYRAPTLSRARSRSYENAPEESRTAPENSRAGRNTSRRNNRSRSQSQSPVRRNRSRSQSRSPVPARNGTHRSNRLSSPPLPSIRRQVDAPQDVGKYRDLPVAGASQTNFVPFIRSSNVLNPAHAESPLPMSREPTEMEKARRAYQGVLHPAKYGQRMEPYYPTGKAGDNGMDPLFNPSLVTEHPTQRQGQILQHLSTLRQALKEKQREMNSISDTMPAEQYGGRRIVSPIYD